MNVWSPHRCRESIGQNSTSIPYFKNTLSKVEIEGNFFCLTKCIYQNRKNKTTAASSLTWSRLSVFSLRSGTRQECLSSTLPPKTVLEVPAEQQGCPGDKVTGKTVAGHVTFNVEGPMSTGIHNWVSRVARSIAKNQLYFTIWAMYTQKLEFKR